MGLGWTLNPGAITRLINGYPDDHSAVANINRDFWEGGETEIYQVGLSVGIANGPSVSASLSFAQDTYRGVGVGVQGGLGLSNVGIQAGISPYGESSLTFGSSATILPGTTAAFSLNSRHGLSAGINSGISAFGVSLMDASISMNSSKVSTNVSVGPSNVHNDKAGRISTRSKNTQVDIPIPVWPGVNLRVGRSYQRYWIDETVSVETYGTLYSSPVASGFNRAFDTYDLLDTDINLAYQENPEFLLGGSFPDVDSYSVTAQGVGGTIKPFSFKGNLYRQDKKIIDAENNEIVVAKSYPFGQGLVSNPVHFRFINDFSNRYEYSPPAIDHTAGQISVDFSQAPTTGKSGNDGYINNNLIGSRDIKWFANKDIVEKIARNPFLEGFVDCQASGFVRDNNTQIGGFTISNVSGVRFHYALPAYSYGEISKSQNTEKQQETNGLYFNQLTRPEKYAYTWFLTAVTGPDYVDRNGNGLADLGDWGYWVRFDYSKLYHDYKWRNPAEGFNRDIDNFDFFSFGKKEVYHLDKIVTESHLAIFDKSLRNDSREVVDINGGFIPTTEVLDPDCSLHCDQICTDQFCSSGTCSEPERTNCVDACRQGCYTPEYPRPTLKLDKIRLFNYRDYQNGELDKSIRTIAFTYDYSLASGTPNSYDETNSAVLLGKLTLQAVSFIGKQNQSLIPPTSFQYKNAPYQKDNYDSWGFYKSDYHDTGSVNLDRFTTQASAMDVDAWSLQCIKTPLGSEIKILYESDRYKTPVVYKKNILTVGTLTAVTNTQTIKMEISNPPPDLPAIEEFLRSSQINLLFRRVFEAKHYCICEGWETTVGEPMGNFYDTKNILLTASSVIFIDNTSISFQDQDLYNYLTNSVQETFYTQSPCINSAVSDFDPGIKILNPVLVSGNVFHHSSDELVGGGTRVSKITIQNLDRYLETNYSYLNGTTTYEPFNFGRIRFDFAFWGSATWPAEQMRIVDAKAAYNRLAFQNVSSLLAVSRILPGPGVNYEFVTVRQKSGLSNNDPVWLPSYAQYQFEVFKEGTIGFDNSPVEFGTSGQYDGISYSKVNFKTSVLKDFTSRVGALKKVSVFSSDGKLLSETINEYLHDNLSGSFEDNKITYENRLADKFTNQGVTEETYSRGRIVLYKAKTKKPYEEGYFTSDERHLLGVVSKIEMFPVVKVGEVHKDYKTGLTNKTENNEFDFYSGELTQFSYTDAFMNTYLTEHIPAYWKYPTMGSAATGGKNMLSQVAATSIYKIDVSLPDRPRTALVSSSAQTWSDQIPSIRGDQVPTTQAGIWRKHAAYYFIGNNSTLLNGDGLTPVANNSPPSFSAWNVGDIVQDGWQKKHAINLYDIYSHALQVEDINMNYMATKMSSDQRLVFATASNAQYDEFAFSGAEDISEDNVFSGGVLPGDGVVDTVSHTGKHGLKLGAGVTGFNVTLATSSKREMYYASIWVNDTNAGGAQFYYQFKDSETGLPLEPQPTTVAINLSATKRAGSWYLFNIGFDVPQPTDPESERQYDLIVGIKNSSSSEIIVDDFRVLPYGAAMRSYVYNDWGELSHILDTNNLFTEYRYDGMGRLSETWKETFANGNSMAGKIFYRYAGQ